MDLVFLQLLLFIEHALVQKTGQPHHVPPLRNEELLQLLAVLIDHAHHFSLKRSDLKLRK